MVHAFTSESIYNVILKLYNFLRACMRLTHSCTKAVSHKSYWHPLNCNKRNFCLFSSLLLLSFRPHCHRHCIKKIFAASTYLSLKHVGHCFTSKSILLELGIKIFKAIPTHLFFQFICFNIIFFT